HRDAWNERTAPARKQELHGRIAKRLERGFGDRTIEIAAELARHFEHGGDLQRAATYLQQASQLALSRLASRDAVVPLERALALLRRAHPSDDPIPGEFAIRVGLGIALASHVGFSSDRVLEQFERARVLSVDMAPTDRIATLSGLWLFHHTRGQHAACITAAREALGIAISAGEPWMLEATHFMLGIALVPCGAYAQALPLLRASLDATERVVPGTRPPFVVPEPPPTAASFASMASWLVGRLDDALAFETQGLAGEAAGAHPFSLAIVFHQCVLHPLLRGEVAAAESGLASLQRTVRQLGLPQWEALARCDRGSIRAAAGAPSEGAALLREGIERYRSLGGGMGSPVLFALLADALLRAGDPEQARAAAESSIDLAEDTGEQWFTPEAHRLRGEALHALARDGAAEALARGSEMARAQGALSLELRLALAEARLARDAAELGEAHRHLATLLDRLSAADRS